MLLTEPSGNLFGLTQNAGMGWDPARLLDPEFLILSTHGGLRAEAARPSRSACTPDIGKWACWWRKRPRELKAMRAIPFAGACTDPCDGRTQGTAGMLDSLPFRNDAAIVLRRLMRSLPTGKGVIGIATCDKGLPAMMMALASRGKPAVLVPGGVTLLPESGEDAAKVQTLGRALCPEPDHPGIRRRSWLPRLRHSRRRMPVSRHRGHCPGGWRGAGTGAAAHRARALRPAHLA